MNKCVQETVKKTVKVRTIGMLDQVCLYQSLSYNMFLWQAKTSYTNIMKTYCIPQINKLTVTIFAVNLKYF